MYKRFLLICFLVTFFSFQTFSQITVGGSDWDVDLTGEISEAGDDFIGTYESVSSQITLSFTVPILGSRSIYVYYNEDPNWNSGMQISVKRTSQGSLLSSLGYIVGGNNYQSVTQNPVLFFQAFSLLGLGILSITGVDVQIQLSNISTSIPADTYSAEIVFTVSN